jgi:hypothetical protein
MYLNLDMFIVNLTLKCTTSGIMKIYEVCALFKVR